MRIRSLILMAGIALSALTADAQTYSMSWYKVAGGGGSSVGTNSGTIYTLGGTIGQQDASQAMTGSRYSVTGGFWSLIALVQTAGLPKLSIAQVGANVIVSWPNTGTYVLQQNNNLAVPKGWATSGYTITTSNGTNSITVPSPTGSLFFRLSQ